MHLSLWSAAGVTALLLVGCSGPATPTTAPSPSPPAASASPPTGADAAAVIDASPAGSWPTDRSGLGDRPQTPAGVALATVDAAYIYARDWLAAAMLDPAVWNGDPSSWLQAGGPMVERERAVVSPGGKAYGYLNTFAEGWRVLEPPRVSGAFTVGTEEQDGEVLLTLTWRGSALYALENADRRGSLVPIYRDITWTWRDRNSIARLIGHASFDNNDTCVRVAAGRFAPAPGALTLPDEYLSPATFVRASDAEAAKQAAAEAACSAASPAPTAG